MINAKVILDSISPTGKRLTTFELRYPKFIHGELMTHRVLSRNASSSRAVPVAKLLQEVRDDALRAGPVYWGAEQKGMQSGAELLDVDLMAAKAAWAAAAHEAADAAEGMVALGVHKSIVNRLLEPFSHINVVATATEWDNFFGLRLHRDAQPEMRVLAETMWATRQASEPGLLKPGDWHLPYVEFVRSPNYETDPVAGDYLDQGVTLAQETAIKVSVARCARVSYKSFETGKRSTIEEDLRLHDRLVVARPMHASPAEHQATPDTALLTFADGPIAYSVGINRSVGFAHPEQHGNLVGWRQYRKTLPGEAVAPLPETYQPKETHHG